MENPLGYDLEKELEFATTDYDSRSNSSSESQSDDFRTTFLGPPLSDYKWAICSHKAVTDNYKTEFCTFFQSGNCKKGSDCSYAHGQSDLLTSEDEWFYVKPFVGNCLGNFIRSKKMYHTILLSTEGGSRQYGFVMADLVGGDGTRYSVPLILEANFSRNKDKGFVPIANTVKSFWEVSQVNQYYKNSAKLVVATLTAKFGSVKNVIKKRDNRTDEQAPVFITRENPDETFEQKVFGPKLDKFKWIIFLPKEAAWYLVNEPAGEKIQKFVSSRQEYDNNLVSCDGNSTTHCLVYVEAHSGEVLLFEQILLLRANFEKTKESCFKPTRNSITHFWELIRLPRYTGSNTRDVDAFIKKKYGSAKNTKKPYYKSVNHLIQTI